MQGAVGRRVARIVVLSALLVSSALVSSSPSTRATTGGPDSYGYIWVDSRSPSPTVPYKWVDITGSGTKLLLGDDNCTYEISLGFQFRYYGTIETNIFVCPNGFITFGVPDSFDANPPNANFLISNNTIAAFGADLNPMDPGSNGVYIYGTPNTSPQRFIISWERVYTSLLSPNVPESFQIILEQNATSKDGRIFLQYKSVASITSPLMGIQNRTGTSFLGYPKPLANNLAVAFLPPTDQGLPPDTLRVTPGVLAPFAVFQGTANVPMMRVDLSTLTNNISFTGMIVNVTGVGALAQDIPSARLWLDNGDGLFFATSDTRLASVNVAGTPPLMNFQLDSPILVAVGPPVRLFVTFNFDANAVPGNFVGAAIANAAAISVTYPDLVSSTGLPFNTYIPANRTRVDRSRDTLSLTATTPLIPTYVSQWETDVSAMELRLDADHNYVPITGMRVELGGNATLADVWAVKLALDVARDGNFTSGVDTLLAVAKPSGSPAGATLLFNVTITAGSPQNFLFLLDIAPAATIGHVVNLRQKSTNVFLPGGSVDVVSTINFPAVSGPGSIAAGNRTTLVLPWVISRPYADGIWWDFEYLQGPENTARLDRPLGNKVPGFLTASNDANRLYLAVDATQDVTLDSVEGVAFGFDTDRDGAPTPGADDVFIVNTTGAARYQYNSSGAWTFVSNCLRYDPGNSSNLACSTAVGPTDFRRTTFHRFYEFAIPLAMLNVTAIAPNTTLRFALAARPHVGLADGGNRSTWPLLFGPAPAPLTYFGDLLLATGFRPNLPPTLNWTNETGYATDAVNPDAGDTNTTFQWRILYADRDRDAPAIGEPQLHVFDGGAELPTSPFEMFPEVGKTNYLLGHIFRSYITGLPCAGTYTYQISVRDARGLTNATPVLPGPLVACPNQPPRLFSASVQPLVDIAGAFFTYRVAYSDPENATPSPSVNVSLKWGDEDLGSYPMTFQYFIGRLSRYDDGAVYTYRTRLYRPGFNYTFHFSTSDGAIVVASEAFFGPSVLVQPPDLLLVGCGFSPPFVVDQGQRMVPFLTVSLHTTSPEVNVSSIRVDRIGTARDADVDKIVLYQLVGANLTFLSAMPPLGSRATFPVNLRITPTQSATLYLFVNVSATAVADDQIGLSLRNETYVRVGPGDTVQPFNFCGGDRAYVNAPSIAANLAVNGFPDASPGILHIRGATPTLNWRFTDPNSADVSQIGFNVSVSSLSPPWEWHQNQSGAASSFVYNGPALAVGHSYQFGISLFDGRLWSRPVTATFHMNTPPPIPQLVRPVDVARDVDPNGTLLWNPVTDGDGDSPITYWFWISADVGFVNPILGTTTGTGTPAPGLARGTIYFWKVAASDGWQISGNSTVWQFTTADVPILGEILGRVLDGSTPLNGVPVQVLVDQTAVDGDISGADGTFHFTNLILRTYTVRVAATGFKIRALSATPTVNVPVTNLGDIVIEREGTTGPPPNNPIAGLPLWAILLILVLAGATVATSLLSLGIALRRRHEDEDEEPSAAEKPAPTDANKTRARPAKGSSRAPPTREKSPPTSAQPFIVDRPVPTATAPPKVSPNPGPARNPSLSEAGRSSNPAPRVIPPNPAVGAVQYECPECGRFVPADATRCVCGAVFEP